MAFEVDFASGITHQNENIMKSVTTCSWFLNPTLKNRRAYHGEGRNNRWQNEGVGSSLLNT